MTENWKINTEKNEWELWVDGEVYKSIPANIPTSVAIIHLADTVEGVFGTNDEEEDEEETNPQQPTF